MCLTDKGLNLIKQKMPDYIETQYRAVQSLSEDEQRQLAGLLEKLIRAANEEKAP